MKIETDIWFAHRLSAIDRRFLACVVPSRRLSVASNRDICVLYKAYSMHYSEVMHDD